MAVRPITVTDVLPVVAAFDGVGPDGAGPLKVTERVDVPTRCALVVSATETQVRPPTDDLDSMEVSVTQRVASPEDPPNRPTKLYRPRAIDAPRTVTEMDPVEARLVTTNAEIWDASIEKKLDSELNWRRPVTASILEEAMKPPTLVRMLECDSQENASELEPETRTLLE